MQLERISDTREFMRLTVLYLYKTECRTKAYRFHRALTTLLTVLSSQRAEKAKFSGTTK